MIRVTVSPGRVARLLLGIIVALTMAHVSLKVYRYYHPQWADPASLWRLFNTSGYGNIPRYFRALLLLNASLLLMTIAYAKRTIADRFTGYWTALAVIFLYLSIDDAASIHELGSRIYIPWLDGTGIQPYAWAVIGVGFVIVFGLSFYRFVFQLPPRIRNLFIASGVIYVLGACGMEIAKGFVARYMPTSSAAIGIVKTSKQTMEALGNTLLIYTLLMYMSLYIGRFHIEFCLEDDPMTKRSKVSMDLPSHEVTARHE
jgi:hypothetical protein